MSTKPYFMAVLKLDDDCYTLPSKKVEDETFFLVFPDEETAKEDLIARLVEKEEEFDTDKIVIFEYPIEDVIILQTGEAVVDRLAMAKNS